MTAYATRAQLATHGLPTGWLAGVSTSDQDDHLARASAVANGYLRKRFKLPLSSWGTDLVGVVCDIACWSLMKRKGFNPDNSSDAAVAKGYDDAIKWLEAVAARDVDPEGVVDSSSDVDEGTVYVESDTQRGW